jgi:transcription antitermination factor NusG
MGVRWYAFQYQANRLGEVQRRLRDQAFKPFFPMLRIRDDKETWREEPLFKGYGFLQFDAETDYWYPINNTIGVIHLLPRREPYPKPVREGLVEALVAADPLELDKFMDILDEFVPGMAVEVQNGYLKGRRGWAQELRGRFMLIALADPAREDARTAIPVLLPTNAVRPVKE